jgi:hypothetical protein
MIWWVVRGLLLGTLLLQSACANSYVRFEPPPAEDPGIVMPATVHLTFKEKVALKGTEGEREFKREFDELNGDLVVWGVGVLTVAGEESKFEVPIEHIERMDV